MKKKTMLLKLDETLLEDIRNMSEQTQQSMSKIVRTGTKEYVERYYANK